MSQIHVWCIGGHDPSGHAGLSVDAKTISSLGCLPKQIVTAVTAQSHATFGNNYPVPEGAVLAQAKSLLKDGRPAAIKVGMLAEPHIIEELTKLMDTLHDIPCVIDPVLCSSSGSKLLNPKALPLFCQQILPRTQLLTPNLPEAQRLTGLTNATAPVLAQALIDMGAQAVLIKDGHGLGSSCKDYYADAHMAFWLKCPRLKTKARGTGCTLSSAIAAAYARLANRQEAVVVGRAYMQRALRKKQHTLFNGPWPVSSKDMPRLIDGPRPNGTFPSLGSGPLGFYPIVPTSQWIKRLTPWKIQLIQLRIKDQPKEIVEQEIQKAVNNLPKRLFINDYWKLACQTKAYGIHLGQSDLDNVDWETLTKAGLRLGISTHSYVELARALSFAPSYIALGPIFPTTTKDMPFAPQGMIRIRIWKQLIEQPLVAIGGLRWYTAAAAYAAGADAVACVRDIIDTSDPTTRLCQWKEQEYYALKR